MSGTSKVAFTEAQQKLIERHRDINVDFDDWYDAVLEDFLEHVNAIGLDVNRDKIQFTGFWSQGDGASFTFQSDSLSLMIDKSVTWLQEHPEPEGGFTDPVRKATFVMANWLVTTFERFRLGGSEVWDEVLGSVHIDATRIGFHYSHAQTVRACWTVDDGVVDVAEKLGLLGKDGATTGDDAKLLDSDEVDGMIEDLANALYKALESEHEHLVSDEQVWEAIVANDLHKEDAPVPRVA